jgi:hypothetical protein
MKKDFEGQRKREHVKSISLLLSDFSMVVFEDAVCTARKESAVPLVAKKLEVKKRSVRSRELLLLGREFMTLR